MVLREFFQSEAGVSLAALREAVTTEPPSLDRLVSSARVLCGSALLAGETRVHGAAAALVGHLVQATFEPDGFRTRLEATIEDLDVLVAGGMEASELDARVRQVMARWSHGRPAALPPEAGAADETEHRAAREIAAVAETMDAAVAAFQSNPRAREWLATVLRSVRALLGSARIETVPVLAECLRAVEDLVVLIRRLDVPVKAEWLDIFRAARDVLRTASAAFEGGGIRGPVPALSRLRTLRDELLARYSGREPDFPGGPDDTALPEP
jgi:hypothetical protein